METTDALPYDFRWRLRRSENIMVEGHAYPADLILQRLSPLLTNERLHRIRQVAAARTWDVCVVADGLYDIGNISAVMRSAESFGYMPFKILERQGSRYKKSDRISRGSEKWLDIERSADPEALIGGLQKNGYKVYATTLEDSLPIQEVDFVSHPVAVVLGNEHAGVRPEVLQKVDGRFRIPMAGFTQSFNISVAAAITFYHIHQERYQALQEGKLKPLSGAQARIIEAYYILRTLGDMQKLVRLLHE